MAQNPPEGFRPFFNKQKGLFYTAKRGKISGFYREQHVKKRLIRDIKIKLADGKKQILKAMDIKSMYPAPCHSEKSGKARDRISNAMQWNKDR